MSPIDSPLVSFLTVNYGQPAVTLALLRSLQTLEYPNFETVVVNNGAPDPALQKETETFPNTRYLETGENLGFAGGNNFGLPHCSGELVFFINNDVEVAPDLLKPIVALYQKDKNFGMASPKIVYHFDKKTIQYAGATELNRLTLRNAGIGHGEEDQGQHDHLRPTAFIHGAAMAVSKKQIEKLGPMRDDYFLYYEEYDWCQRFKQAGLNIYYCGLSAVFHKESVSTGEDSPLKMYYLTRNRLLFSRRNFGAATQAANWLYFSGVALPFHSIKNTARGRFQHLKAIWRGWKDAVVQKSGML